MPDNTMPTWVTVLISLLTLLGGAVGTWVINIMQTRNKGQLDDKKQTSELKISENEQAFKIYKDLLDKLQKQVDTMSTDMNKLEDERLHCREENASLKAELRSQASHIAQQDIVIADLRKDLEILRGQFHKE